MSIRPVRELRRSALVIVMAVAAFVAFGVRASAQSLGELNRRLESIEPQVAAGMTDPAAASAAISQLDEAESDFARIADGARSTSALLGTYDRLEDLLNRMYTTYQARKDACIQKLDSGGTCDYDQPEQLALRALYPLSWLRFTGAGLYGDEPGTARRLLNEAIDGFTNSTLIIINPELVRENMLGRAFAERELGKYEHGEYAQAVADFKRIMEAGPDTRQYRAAEQGLATTYAAMGKIDQAQGLSARLSNGATGAQKSGLEMLHLREMFRQEAAASDPAKRAAMHRAIVAYARDRQNNRDDWAIVVATAGDTLHDPIAEFGNSSDPFENWLLANVLYYKHEILPAANAYFAAARSGAYPKAWKYAADLFYLNGRLDMVEQVAHAIVRQPSNPDAQWASYMLYKIPRLEWERGGMRSDELESRWAAAANDYLNSYPHGQYAFEPRFRLAEMYQRKGEYAQAAAQYEQVGGNSNYAFTARYNAAECYYRAITPAAEAGGKAPAAQNSAVREALKQKAIAALNDAIRMEPGAERTAPQSQRKALRDSRGRAIFMLVTLLEHEPAVDYRTIATLLENYEAQYPAMSAKFDEIFQWRLVALNRTGQYQALAATVATLVAHDAANPARNDYIKGVGLEFWKSAQARQAAGDQTGYLAEARLTATTYEYFARQAAEGKIPVKNLTGTLSLLGQAYLALGETDRAAATFTQVAAADPGSPDANAGLARIAQMHKDYKDALDRWSRVESLAAESDSLFYESKYNMAEIFAEQGNVASACDKLAVTRSEHPNLGSPGMKEQWGTLQRKLCPKHTEG
ncbi:MAG TPA: tetratricopeptide repeat protein [Candidatus Binataceae bacterium]|nr:tetratricopeptide repeat protein [Candidatus Binataceae bacterium]